MSTRNDDEADQYEPHYEEEEDTRGIGYEDPPDYDDHEDHQQSGNANPPGAADEERPHTMLGYENSAPDQTDAPEDVPSYDNLEPEGTHNAGEGTVFHKGGINYQGREFVRATTDEGRR